MQLHQHGHRPSPCDDLDAELNEFSERTINKGWGQGEVHKGKKVFL